MRTRTGYSLVEVMVTGAVVCALLAVVLPMLSAAREQSRREQCADQQRRLFGAWHGFMRDHVDALPYVPDAAAWFYGGVRFSSLDGRPFLDGARPLNEYLPVSAAATRVFRSPSDRGIRGEGPLAGTAGRTAFRAFGTSYRANAQLLDAPRAGLSQDLRGVRIAELWAVPSRVVLMGTPIWFEIYEQTGRDADWNGEGDRGNLLFLDGTVRFMAVLPRHRMGSAVIDAIDPAQVRGIIPGPSDEETADETSE